MKDIYLYGEIVPSGMEFDNNSVSPKTVKDFLDGCIGEKEIRIHINSLGGAVFPGFDIINMIENFKRTEKVKITSVIDDSGFVSGIASAIAVSADKVCMAKNAIFMTIRPFFVKVGDVDISETKTLENAEGCLVSMYMRKFNGSEKELRRFMKVENIFCAEDALKYGFVDEIFGN